MAKADTAPRLAKGTGSELDPQTTNGICFASRCNTVDEFVATFHRYCESSAIFIPDAKRAVGTDLAFSFELADAHNVLLGVGNVIEEFSTADNRFARPGIVVSVKKLKRDSIDVFKRMLAARGAAHVDSHTDERVDPRIPQRALGRAMTGPIMIDQVRASSVLGLPPIAVVLPVMPIPATPLRVDVRGSRPALEPDAIGPEEDTLHDDFPFALRHELQLREERPQVKAEVAVDDGWEIEPTPAAELGALPSPDTIFVPAAHESREPQAIQFASEPASAHEADALPPPPVDELPITARRSTGIPVAIPRVASDAMTTPRSAAISDAVVAHRPRLIARAMIAVVSAVLVAVPALIGLRSVVGVESPSDPYVAPPPAIETPTPMAEQRSEPIELPPMPAPRALKPPALAPNRAKPKQACASLDCV